MFGHLGPVIRPDPGRSGGYRWIASRSDLARAGQAQGAWPGHPLDPWSRGSEVYPSLSRIWTPESGKTGSATKRNGEYFRHFCQTGRTRKSDLFRYFPDPDHTVIRELVRTRTTGFWPKTGHLGTCARKPVFRDSGRN